MGDRRLFPLLNFGCDLQHPNRTSNVIVSVSTDPGKVLSSEVIENVQPAWTEEEYTLVEEVRYSVGACLHSG